MNDIKENNFFIPRKLAVGFDERKDTYTGKLGYVTYYDHLNKMRKQKSWESWRLDSIEPLYIDNTPTTGFILNRSVGGGRCGWDTRKTYARVWDPRGFEVEISIDNLLWLLEWSDSSNKALSGEFVYSWYGTDLVLMPTNSTDYTESKIISDKMYKKTSFKEKDLIPGTLYKFKGKENNELVYIGKVKFAINFTESFVEHHIFVNMNDEEVMWQKYNQYHTEYKNSDCIIIKKPVSIIAEIQQNYISEDKINEYIHRFELSSYSSYFWNNMNTVVDKFIPDHSVLINKYKEPTTIYYANKEPYPSTTIIETVSFESTNFEQTFKYLPKWLLDKYYKGEYDYTANKLFLDNVQYLRADISEDGKNVTLYEPLYKLFNVQNYWAYCKSDCKHIFKYATIDLNNNAITKICDPGKCERKTSFGSNNEQVNYDYESESGELIKAEENATPINIEDNRNFLFYITKDNYVSVSLQIQVAYSNKLRFNCSEKCLKETDAWHIPEIINLPIKAN